MNLPDRDYNQTIHIEKSYTSLQAKLQSELRANDTVVIMSNGSFGGLHEKLFIALNSQSA